MNNPISFLRLKSILVLTFLLSFGSNAQVLFEQGYFIRNSGNKVECLLKNKGWKKNPTEFEYRLSENDEIRTNSIDSVSEFSVYNTFKYIRDTVDIDRTSDDITHITYEKEPDFKREVLMLKVLIEGKGSLFSFQDEYITRYFFKIENESMEQLIYKRYLIKSNSYGTNNHFRTQLFKLMDNDDMDSVVNLDYVKSDLVGFFENYNQGLGSEMTSFVPQKGRLIQLSPFVGLNRSQMEYSDYIAPWKNTDFDPKFGVKFGLDFTFIMPFNHNKWAFFFRPGYMYYNSEAVYFQNTIIQEEKNASFRGQFIELPIGIRYYMYLNAKSRLSLSLAYTRDLSINSFVDFEVGNDYDAGSVGYFTPSVGYHYGDRLNFWLSYQSRNHFVTVSNNVNPKLRTVTLSFGYTLF
jgi:hypothetical protein